jgi:hypothetical protein
MGKNRKDGKRERKVGRRECAVFDDMVFPADKSLPRVCIFSIPLD